MKKYLNSSKILSYGVRAGLFLAVVLTCSLIYRFGAIEPWHYRLASDPHLNGKGQAEKCMDYALALSSRLAAKGIHGRLIFYRWKLRGTDHAGSHVFVLYQLPNGEQWIVDNEIPHPIQVPKGTTLMQMVFMLSENPDADVDVELEEGLNRLSFF